MIRVALPNGSVKVFESTNTTGDFRGEDSDGSTFQYIRNKNDQVVGSLIDFVEHTVSQVYVDASGNQIVLVTKSSDFPPEAEAIETERMLQEKYLGARSSTDRLVGDENISELHVFGRMLKDETSLSAGRMLDIDIDDDVIEIHVLGLWTPYAECRRSDLTRGCNRTSQTASNMIDMLDLAVKETNDAYALSGVNAELVLVHSELIEYTEAASNTSEVALHHLTSTTDGIIDDVHDLRSQYGADLVAMIIDDDEYCGIANLGPYKSGMFSVTSWRCATGYYSFGNGKWKTSSLHSFILFVFILTFYLYKISLGIGHNLGCRQDQGTLGVCDSTSTNYGFRDPSAMYRTIMAEDCVSGQCDNNAGGGCDRVQRFSTPELEYTWNGNVLGQEGTDCVDQINSVRTAVAEYFPSATTTTTSSTVISR